jgi:hypothetical protein
LETSPESSDFTDIHATHDTHNPQDVSVTNKIHKAKAIRTSSRIKTSTTTGFQPTELRTTDYITKQMKIIDDVPGVLSKQAINWSRATVDVQLGILDANLSERLQQAEKYTKICDLNEILAAKVKDLEATKHVRDGPSMELEATQREIEQLEEELQRKNHRSDKLERRLD